VAHCPDPAKASFGRTITQRFCRIESRLRQHSVFVTTRLYVSTVHCSAVTILPYGMFSNMAHVRSQKNPSSIVP
jgi:hypothetical protein